jgi:ABC-type uncharacterized transport system permease subunit
MSGGRGYIALAMVILAGWRPAFAALACVGVAVSEALTIAFQITGSSFPSELVAQLPYAVTLAVLGGWASKNRRPPDALGKL